jgi:N-acetylmuramoyl-L-alanine amidase, family 4
MALEQAAQQGVQIGYMRGRQNEYKSSSVSSNISKDKKYILSFMPGTFSLPMNTNNMIVTSERGERNLGLKGASRNHKGIDIKADNAPLFATEDNGRVIQAGFSGKGGNTVSIEYDRPDNSKVVVTYMHLSKIQVKEGDIVNGHQQIGVSGATGNVTGPHLHFQTDYIDSQGNKKNLDSAAYLAEISLRTNIPVRAISEKSKVDLVASYKSEMAILPSSTQLSIADRINENGYDTDEERRRRENQQDGSQESTGDLLADLIAPLLKSAISLAIRLSSLDEQGSVSKEDADLQAEKEVMGEKASIKVEAYHSDRELAAVDVNKLSQTSSAIYESEIAVEKQQQNQIKMS